MLCCRPAAEVASPSGPVLGSGCPWFFDFEIPALDEDSHEGRVLSQLSSLDGQHGGRQGQEEKAPVDPHRRALRLDREEQEQMKRRRLRQRHEESVPRVRNSVTRARTGERRSKVGGEGEWVNLLTAAQVEEGESRADKSERRVELRERSDQEAVAASFTQTEGRPHAHLQLAPMLPQTRRRSP
eukprot:764505-Hanusia_phi.AAC.2